MGGGGGIFNNSLLFSLLFSGSFCGGDKAAMEGDKFVIRRIPPVIPAWENPGPASEQKLFQNQCLQCEQKLYLIHILQRSALF